MEKTVLITGVYGGIGYASAGVFKNNGWNVIGVDKDVSKGHDGRIDLSINADISDSKNILDLFNLIKTSGYNGINCLVNNAAVQVAKSILDTTEEEWDYVFRSNIKSIFNAVKSAFELLKTAGGAIVNVSSVHAFATSKNISAYASSKGAILAFTRSLALEFIDHGIRVNCVLPGAVNTNMLAEGMIRARTGDESVQMMIDKLGMRHPIKRVGDPSEIGKLIYFLGDGEQSSFITGQSFIADGGALAQLSTEVY